jgi:hypothetical protein
MAWAGYTVEHPDLITWVWEFNSPPVHGWIGCLLYYDIVEISAECANISSFKSGFQPRWTLKLQNAASGRFFVGQTAQPVLKISVLYLPPEIGAICQPN